MHLTQRLGAMIVAHENEAQENKESLRGLMREVRNDDVRDKHEGCEAANPHLFDAMCRLPPSKGIIGRFQKMPKYSHIADLANSRALN